MNNENNIQNEVNNTGQVSVQNNVPGPASVENVIPTGSSEQVVIDNSKKKKGSNFIMILVMILLILFVVYMDEVVAYVMENIITTNPTDVIEPEPDNLIKGYIMLDDSTGSMKVKSIKFYNFKKNAENNSIIMNYVSDKGISDVAAQNLYVEFYNVDKQVLHKELFNVEEGIPTGAISSYSVAIKGEIFPDVTYALVRAYTDEELNATKILTCKYERNNEGFNEIYIHDFNFINDMLVSYKVDKKLEIFVVSKASNKSVAAIKSEYDKLVNANLSSDYTEDRLTYFIDLQTLDVNYIPLYDKGVTSAVVKNKEIFKEWVCE